MIKKTEHLKGWWRGLTEHEKEAVTNTASVGYAGIVVLSLVTGNLPVFIAFIVPLFGMGGYYAIKSNEPSIRTALKKW